MKAIKNFFLLALSAFFLILYQSLQAQTNIPDDGILYTYQPEAKQYLDLKIPANTSANYVYLEAKGGDGGTGAHDHPGGGGALMSAIFEVGKGANQIAPGSTIRLIPGMKGNSHKQWCCAESGGGGGGGTGILVLPAGETNWNNADILIVAGGGGGGGDHGDGLSANTAQNGTKGNGAYGGKAGTKGKAGASTDEACGGAGAFQNGTKRSDQPSSCTPAQKGFPAGGDGGKDGCEDSVGGGWGFGGGGSANMTGGGGGGYSGGGGGGLDDHGTASDDDAKERGGGGGGSFLSSTLNKAHVVKEATSTTSSPQHGYARYSLYQEDAVDITKMDFQNIGSTLNVQESQDGTLRCTMNGPINIKLDATQALPLPMPGIYTLTFYHSEAVKDILNESFTTVRKIDGKVFAVGPILTPSTDGRDAALSLKVFRSDPSESLDYRLYRVDQLTEVLIQPASSGKYTDLDMGMYKLEIDYKFNNITHTVSRTIMVN